MHPRTDTFFSIAAFSIFVLNSEARPFLDYTDQQAYNPSDYYNPGGYSPDGYFPDGYNPGPQQYSPTPIIPTATVTSQTSDPVLPNGTTGVLQTNGVSQNNNTTPNTGAPQGISNVWSELNQGLISQTPSDQLQLAMNGHIRAYMVSATDQSKYEMLDVRNKQFDFTIDLSNVPCGYEIAVYFVGMQEDGASDGSQYCDAQGQFGGTCNEMDIMEANSVITKLTAHPCQGGSCAKAAEMQVGQRWSEGGIDPTKPITVSTNFQSNSIIQSFSQNGKTLATITLNDDPSQKGGLQTMYDNFAHGMVLVASIWTDGNNLQWLNGQCSETASPSNVAGVISGISLK